MKKLLLIILSLTIIIVSGCQKSLTPEQHREETSTMTEDEKKKIHLNVLQAVIDISDANETVTKALEAHIEEDLDAEVEYYYDAIAVLEQAQEKVNKISTTEDNQLCNTLKLLIAEYKQTAIVTEECIEDFNAENIDRYYTLMNLSVGTHFNLILYSQAFANLYAIRYFDSLPEADAKKDLKDYWDNFNFIEEDELLPKNIDQFDKKELYIRWARQFSEDFEETEEFSKDLQILREEDELTPESNKKWLDFCRKHIFNTEVDLEIDEIYQNLNDYNVV